MKTKKKLIQFFLLCTLTSPAFITPAQTVTVTAATGGDYHSLFIKSDGTLWVMGYNNSGDFGDGSANGNTNKPEMITKGVVKIALGFDNSLFIKTNGTLWGMGGNDDGGLGDGTDNQTNSPEMITSNVTAIAD